jgi:hypothetical protein
MSRFIEPRAFKFDAMGRKLYTVSWRYVFRLDAKTTDYNPLNETTMAIPANPRLAGSARQLWPSPDDPETPPSGVPATAAALNLPATTPTPPSINWPKAGLSLVPTVMAIGVGKDLYTRVFGPQNPQK